MFVAMETSAADDREINWDGDDVDEGEAGEEGDSDEEMSDEEYEDVDRYGWLDFTCVCTTIYQISNANSHCWALLVIATVMKKRRRMTKARVCLRVKTW